jgi:putative nucleotidyltransferase with HDIG domain
MRWAHLAKRFYGSLSKKPLSLLDIEWVRSVLSDAEYELWCRYSFPDRRHTIAVARETLRLLGATAERPVLAAALLHDIGKIESKLGTFGRVAATLVGQKRSKGRFAVYFQHNERGAALLKAARSDPLTIAWAEQHELPPDRWTLPPEISDALIRADNA